MLRRLPKSALQRVWFCKICYKRYSSAFTTAFPGKKDTSGPLPKSYNPQFVESVWYSWWEKSGFFRPEYNKNVKHRDGKEPFVVCLPPPNVTGSLHLGHTLMVAIQDSLIRWFRKPLHEGSSLDVLILDEHRRHRMNGRETLWIPGSDHAGIATQIVVEKKLQKERQIDRHTLGREQFVREVHKWKEECGNEIDQQLKRLGASLDWSRPNFTMSEEFSRAVQEAFISLHDDGTIYRGNRLINWSCALRSTISDIEVDKQPITGATDFRVPGYEDPIQFGVLHYFSYPLDSGTEIPVATTRIETMLGDTAIAVHPDDVRYSHLIGRKVQHPFIDRMLPIIASETVDKDFGTGAVKVTPAHDFNDYDLGERYSLDSVTILGEDGTIDCPVPRFNGLRRFDARLEVIDALKEKGLYGGQKEHAMVVPVCSRSSDIVEPLLKEQWFARCDNLATQAIAAVESGELSICPKMHCKTWQHWLLNIRDWCISRQLWWGHRIPAYRVSFRNGHPKNQKADSENMWVSGRCYQEALEKAAAQLNVNEEHLELTQDDDVLDTWFSSALFPFAVHGWPSQTDDLDRFYPSTLLETGHDIIFFWVARMVMMGQKLTGRLPFKEVYFHSMVRDAHGRKMSKSLGNVIDPVDVIQGASLEDLHARLEGNLLDPAEKERSRRGQAADYPRGIPECGTDALRFTLCTYKAQGEDVNLDVNTVQTYRFFCNKIWNAALFTLNALPDNFEPSPMSETLADCSIMDRWILSRLSDTTSKINSGFQGYDFPIITSAIHKFWVQNLCDVYLESIKLSLRADDHRAVVSRNVLHTCVDAGLRLIGPFMPYLSEEIFQRLPRKPEREDPSICVAPYPTTGEFPMFDGSLEERVALSLDIVNRIRSIQKEFGIPKLSGHIVCNNDDLRGVLSQLCPTMATLSRCRTLQMTNQEPDRCLATTVASNCALFVEMEDIDVPRVLERLQAKLAKTSTGLKEIEAQRSMDGYEEKVPQNIREKHDQQMEVLQSDSARLSAAAAMLKTAR